MSTLRVTIDRTRCIGAGHCIRNAPAVFDQDDEGLVALLDPHPPEASRAAVQRAVQLCPARVIQIQNEEK